MNSGLHCDTITNTGTVVGSGDCRRSLSGNRNFRSKANRPLLFQFQQSKSSEIKINEKKQPMKIFIEGAGLEVADRCVLSLRSPLLKYLQCYATKLEKY